MVHKIIYGHDETCLGGEHVELSIYSLDKDKDEVTRHMMAAQGVVAALKRKLAISNLVLNDLSEIEVDIGLHAEA